MKNYCYKGYIREFLKIDESEWLCEMKKNYALMTSLDLNEKQITAWKDSFVHIKAAVRNFEKSELYIIFEYTLPHEGGRRPDIILLGQDSVIILEFKMKQIITSADLDQVASYTRDISDYHLASRDIKRYAFLVLTRSKKMQCTKNKIICCSPDKLPQLLKKALRNPIEYNPEEWLNSEYRPLPSIVEAAKLVMQHKDLPELKSVINSSIPNGIRYLNMIANVAEKNNEFVLVIVTGAPGTGKTFLGLQFAYNNITSIDNIDSIFLSGNRPLISVLSDALESKVFIKNIYSEFDEYYVKGKQEFKYHIVVYDESQRAWDKYKISEKYNFKNLTEAEMLINMIESNVDWGVLVILFGEGQEINKGERYGIKNWARSIKNSNKNWRIISPSKLDKELRISNILDTDRDCLELTTTIRTHRACRVSDFVNNILDGNIEHAKSLLSEIMSQGYNIWITRNIELAKEYCYERYENETGKKYGLLASSKASNLDGYINNSYKNTKNINYNRWFNNKRGEEGSCCNFEDAVTEFGCQGLEIDMPIICWGNDMKWYNHKWELYILSEPSTSLKNIYRINSYRVLMTRGRDGFIIFIPENCASLDTTFEMFSKNLGIPML